MVSALLSRCLILVLGTLYPAYRSYKAIKNKDVREHVKWMMYWIVFALFTTLETFLDIFFSWFPFYYEIKILFILWVLSPATRGSSLLYKKVVHPMLISREKEIDELIEKTKQQGYTTFLQLFSSGFQYASSLFLNSAMKGQLFLGNQLKKSLSLNDVYESSSQPPENFYINKIHEPINEDDESSATSAATTRPIRKQTYTNANIRDYEIIDDDDIDSTGSTVKRTTIQQQPANRRRASSKQLTSSSSGSSVSSYKSNDASHFGTITRAKISKSKSSTSSSSSSSSSANPITAQTNFDNDS